MTMATTSRSDVSGMRAKAQERLAGLPLPTQKSEDYRFTSLKDMALPAKAPAKGVSSSTMGALPAGVTVGDVAKLPALPAAFEDDYFAQTTLSLADDVLFLCVAPGAKISETLRLNHLFDEGAGTMATRTVILVDEGASVSFAEEIGSASGGSAPGALFLGLTQIIARTGSRVEVAQIQGLSRGAQCTLRLAVEAGEGAEVRVTPIQAGAAKSLFRMDATCAAPGSLIKVIGAVRTGGTQHCDVWVTSRHPAKNTRAELDLWSVAGGASKIVFNGNIVIPPTGILTEAYQKNKNLLLSRQAEINTVPKLEIATDDVKCAHGASVSSVSEEQLYYARSRGIAAAEAEEMIVRGFTAQATLHLPEDGLRERAEALLDNAGRAS